MVRTRQLATWVAMLSAVLAFGYISVVAPTGESRAASKAASAEAATGTINWPEMPVPSVTAVETGRAQISSRAAVRNLSLAWFSLLAAAALARVSLGRRTRGLGALLEQAIRSQSERSSPDPGRRAPPLLAA